MWYRYIEACEYALPEFCMFGWNQGFEYFFCHTNTIYHVQPNTTKLHTTTITYHHHHVQLLQPTMYQQQHLQCTTTATYTYHHRV